MSSIRPDSPQWLSAQVHGNAGEMAIAKWFQRRSFDVTKAIAPESGYHPHLFSTIKVKNDVVALTTGNVAVEFACNGKPSSIATTRAAFWVFIVPTDRLHTLINDGDFPTKLAGDGMKSRIVLAHIIVLREMPHVRCIQLNEQETV